jgi:peptidoglycan/xylan/chitin deacetylase (PgdA/CDA1 family)
MYPISPSPLLRLLYPGAIWRVPTDQKRLFLTFDDGPTPGVTDWVLDSLAEYQASGTFFMLGKNAERHPDLVQKVKAAGHRIGNHGYEHLDGLRTSYSRYLENVQLGAMFTGTKLFRPPYGRIGPRLFFKLSQDYRIVFWDLLPGDWDQSISSETVWKRIERNIRPGSIIVLHDSEKAMPHLKVVLPKLLKKLQEEGYSCPRIPRRM